MKMKKMFLLFSHTLTSVQIKDATESLGVKEFVSLPTELQILWSNISPEFDDLFEYLQPLKSYLDRELSKEDVVLIQGDFGAGYMMINFVKEQGCVACYATTKRNVVEKEVDTKIVKTSVFEHVMFREYL